MNGEDHDLLVRIDERVGELQGDMNDIKGKLTGLTRWNEKQDLELTRINQKQKNNCTQGDRSHKTWGIIVTTLAIVVSAVISTLARMFP